MLIQNCLVWRKITPHNLETGKQKHLLISLNPTPVNQYLIKKNDAQTKKSID
jgi:hypothetical protein